ncbi:hypothetical protein [Sphingobacterium anhuiense]|uniref:hypothetical protein n=1 Tax=Sphingobacterium anhuiense TaxID=493780 RepID=UPI003C2BD2BE
MMLENITVFLRNRGWRESEQTDKFLLFTPPEEFRTESEFRLYIPLSTENYDINSYLQNLYQTIAEIYSLKIDDLEAIFNESNSVLKIRIFDKEIVNGKISLKRFDSLIEKITDILSDTASFVIDKNLMSSRVPKEVNRYLQKCSFMQTEIGSFVAKFQLPDKQLLKEREAFRDVLYCEEVNNKFSEVLNFVNDVILESDLNIDDEFIIRHPHLFNLKLYKDIHSLLENSTINGIDVSIHSTNRTTRVYNENINKLKLYKLENVVNKIKEIGDEVGEFKFTGRILSLKSKDPDGVSNQISIGAADDGVAMTVTINVDSDDYRRALEAHKYKQNIIVTGRGRKSQDKAKIIEVYSFEIQE